MCWWNLTLEILLSSESRLENQIMSLKWKKKTKHKNQPLKKFINSTQNSEKHINIDIKCIFDVLDYVAQLLAMPTSAAETPSWLPNSFVINHQCYVFNDYVVPLPPTFQPILPTEILTGVLTLLIRCYHWFWWQNTGIFSICILSR